MGVPAAAAGVLPGPGPVRVFIVDDHELVRQSLRDVLEGEGLEVVGECWSGVEASRGILDVRPDVAVLDGRLPDGTGIEVCRNVRSVDPGVQCLILTSYDDDEALRGAVLAGAAGYALRQVRSHDLVEAIRRAAAGESLLAPGVVERVRAGLPESPRAPGLDGLTARETEVLALIAEGLSNRQISEDLVLTEKTVQDHVSALLAKLGYARSTRAIGFSTRWASGRLEAP
jgi:two-component system response regulator DevR